MQGLVALGLDMNEVHYCRLLASRFVKCYVNLRFISGTRIA